MKKQYTIVIVLILVVAGLSFVALTKYEHQPKNITLNQAISQRDTALQDLQVHDQINKFNLDNANSQVKTLTAQNTTLCAQIKAAKLAQPICK
jgi:uncharacterized protein YpuA (DUF1002 family)